jgi:hypothetical protein
MADTKVSALASLSGANAATGDIVPIADVSAATTKGITLTELVAAILEVVGVGLDDMNDVVLDTPVSGNALLFNGTDWLNTPIAALAVTFDPATLNNTASTEVQSVLEDYDAAIQSAAGTGIPATLGDAAGDLLVASGADAFAKLTKGSNYTFLGVNGSGTVAYGDPRAVPQNVNTQTGTTYTLVLTDAGKLVTCSNASSITLTVPPAASVAFPAGTVIDLCQYGAGQVTIAPGAAVTINTSSSLKMRTQYSAASLVLSATADTWFLVGDLEPLGQSVNAQTGTTYTAVLSDAEKVITLSNASAITLTVPANASVAYPTGTHIDLIQTGAGQVTVVGAGGVTVLSTPTLKFRAQYSGATLVKTATNGWYLLGDLAAS